MEKLPGNYIAGFVDGEGCFSLSFRRDIRRERKNTPTYFYWRAEFIIVLHRNDLGILKMIQDTLGCGKITFNKRGNARYSIQNIKELKETVVPFFERYPMYAKKKYDFALWKEAVEILSRNKQSKSKEKLSKQKGFGKIEWNKNDLSRLTEIKETQRLRKQ